MTSAQRHSAGHQVSVDLISMETASAVVSSRVCALQGPPKGPATACRKADCFWLGAMIVHWSCKPLWHSVWSTLLVDVLQDTIELVLRAHQEQASDEANALDTKSCFASHLIVSFSSYNGAM